MVPDLNQTPDLSKYTVLAVDDIPLNLFLIKKMLSRLNLKFVTADNGEKALKAIDDYRPDLVLLDLMMPVMDGFEVIRRVRSNPVTAKLPIVILSALNSNEDIVKGFDLGANEFITKPIIMEKLLNAVITQFKLIEGRNIYGDIL